MKCLIVAGGQIDLPFAKQILECQDWDLLISADRGLHFFLEAGLVPDWIVGDFDSADPEEIKPFQENCPEKLQTFPAEKDETDSEIALDCAIEAGADRITILGGTGSRLDHVLGNLQLLKRALDAGAECCLVDPHNRIRMIKDDLAINRDEQFGDYVSLIPFSSEVEGLTLTGFAYEVEDFTLQNGIARGISNEICAPCAHITLKSGELIVIESRD